MLRIPPNETVSLCGFPHNRGKIPMTAIAMDVSSPSAKPGWRWFALLLLLFVGFLITLTVYSVVYGRETKILASEAEAEAQQQAAALTSELEKQRSVPVILAMDTDLVEFIRKPSEEHSIAISKKLETLRDATRGAVIYVIDESGRTLSASNYAQPDTFVGRNFSFREYFTEALKHGEAQQFAMGAVSMHPGLYFSHRIESGDGQFGVVVDKVEFDKIEASWRRPSTRRLYRIPPIKFC